MNDAYVYNASEAGHDPQENILLEANLILHPDSSDSGGIRLYNRSWYPYGQAIIKNRYSDRSFIKPDQRLRQLEIDLKFNLVQPKIKGARLIIVDNSIVRGNAMKHHAACTDGGKEIHIQL